MALTDSQVEVIGIVILIMLFMVAMILELAMYAASLWLIFVIWLTYQAAGPGAIVAGFSAVLALAALIRTAQYLTQRKKA